jgi:peptidoglycan/LPS O-acetylase OafA/YrhL
VIVFEMIFGRCGASSPVDIAADTLVCVPLSITDERFEEFPNNFGAMRILLAAAVVFSNSFLLGQGVTDADPMKGFDHGQAITGHVAVDLFFIMSGYLVTLSLTREPALGRYFLHRIRRVYPGFVLAAVFSFLVVLPLAGGRITPPAHLNGTLGGAEDFLYRTLRLGSPTYAGAFHANPFPEEVNQSLWSIPYGFWCYILAAVLSAIGALRSRYRVLLLAVLEAVAIAFGMWALAAHYFPAPHWALATIGYPGMWARILPMFLGGMLLATVKDRVPVKGWVALAALALLAVAAQIPYAWPPVLAIAGAYLLIYFAYAPWIRLSGATTWGDPSYGMYLLSFPIQQTIVAHYAYGRTMHPYLLFAVSLPVSVAAGYASWWLVERWFVANRISKLGVSEPASPPIR